MEDVLQSSLDLFRRLPPQNIESNLNLLVSILPELADDLSSSVDQPMSVRTDSEGKQYLACDFNRDGSSFRSPWTNAYDPALSDGTVPSPKLRQLEIALNDAFDVYRELYYEGGVSSVYVWDLDDGFAGVVLLKKANGEGKAQSSWDSVHVFETSERGRTAHYKLTSTVMLYMSKELSSPTDKTDTTTGTGGVTLGGNMTRQKEVDASHDPSSPATVITSHIGAIGKLVEDMEINMRSLLQDVYFSKSQDIVSSLRSSAGYNGEEQNRRLQEEMVGLLRGKNSAAAQ